MSPEEPSPEVAAAIDWAEVRRVNEQASDRRQDGTLDRETWQRLWDEGEKATLGHVVFLGSLIMCAEQGWLPEDLIAFDT